jgi:hypothetical protein
LQKQLTESGVAVTYVAVPTAARPGKKYADIVRGITRNESEIVDTGTGWRPPARPGSKIVGDAAVSEPTNNRVRAYDIARAEFFALRTKRALKTDALRVEHVFGFTAAAIGSDVVEKPRIKLSEAHGRPLAAFANVCKN